jgi:AraC-like DNA-binding protein
VDTFRWSDYCKENETIRVNKSVYIPGGHEDHKHSFLEITYVSNGTGYHWFGGKKYYVRKGDLFFIDYTISHYFRPASDDFEWMNCIFLPEAIDVSLIHNANAQSVLKFVIFYYLNMDSIESLNDFHLADDTDRFYTLFHEMHWEYENAKTGYQEILRQYLLILLIRIFRSYSQKRVDDSFEDELFQNILAYLHENSSKQIKLEDLARQAFLSTGYFSAFFKQKTGMKFTEYLHKLRIDKACELLAQSNLSVNSVMNTVGYQDSKFFYDIFKRYTGFTPGNYRNQA